ncbi:MAG TPA: hypothetical protein VFO40_06055 [Chthoniobacterales bacterium]|nr:hypothetical protein [Chthoniobacterales bacterium]
MKSPENLREDFHDLAICHLVLLMQLTRFLAQLLGLYCIIVAVVMLVRKEAMLGIIMNLIQNRSLLFLVEILGLITGLAMVLGHNVWSKGLLAFIVTLVGWVALVRSTVLLFLPSETIGRFLKIIRYEQNYYVVTTIILILGAYLTYAGFVR